MLVLVSNSKFALTTFVCSTQTFSIKLVRVANDARHVNHTRVCSATV